MPVLVACAHGTRVAGGQRVMADLQASLAAARPGLDVRPAHLDVQGPKLDDVVAEVAAQGHPMVIVPLLLSTGYHVRVDVARAVDAAGGSAVAAAALGPDPVLVDLLQARLTAAGAGRDDVIVLAAAGSSDPHAAGDVERMATALASARDVPVLPGFLAAAAPTVTEAVAEARERFGGRPVSVASYLLAPGYFSSRLDLAGADRVAATLAPAPALTRLVLERFDRASTLLPTPS